MKNLSVIWYLGKKIRNIINFVLPIDLPDHLH